MDKDNVNSAFDIDNDPEFNENFYKNIEKALGGTENKENATDNVTDGEKELRESVSEPNDVPHEQESEDSKNMSETFNEGGSVETSQEESAAAVQTAEVLSQEDVDDELVDIHSALAKQICEEMDSIVNEKTSLKKKKMIKIQSGIILTILCLLGFVFFLGGTKPGNKLLLGMGVNLSGTIWATWTGNFDDGKDVIQDTDYVDQEDLQSDGQEIDPSTITWPVHPGEGRHQDGVYNILLLGEEAIGSGDARGRTDVIVIATMDTNKKTLKLTSLMRDTFVQIPGYKDNKLNSAYEKGGLDLLYETIALNFDIHLDGCIMVNFNNFEKIIDKIGGLDLTLTSGEAKYLNTTNYISNPAYRNVVEGTQHLNGNQVLGYSRVRKRATITGNNNDYGRTDRHRIVLNAIFEKCKSKSKADLASMMIEFLPMITTDIDSDNFQMLLNSFIDMGMSSLTIEQLRIPADGAFDDTKKVRGMSVVLPDLNANINILHNFIFGDPLIQNTDGTTADVQNGETTVTPAPSN